MIDKNYPIYEIQNFKCNDNKTELYINTFKKHLEANSFTETPHSHKFYLLALFTNGKGVHKIDFNSYQISNGSMFFIQPGQVHSWQLSHDIDGYIVFCNQEAYNLYFSNKRIEDYIFYLSPSSKPELILNSDDVLHFSKFFEIMMENNVTDESKKKDIILNLIDIIHIEIERRYFQNKNHNVHSYNHKMEQFYEILNRYYYCEKSPTFYADKLNITLKHLNRICKTILNSTVTEMISKRVILESKRMLVNDNKTISEIANALGYENYSYFSKVFKKNTGITPREFKIQVNNN